MPKDKKPKHVEDCVDKNCKTCTVGEVQVALTSADGSPLTAIDIYLAAKEEAEKQNFKEDADTHSQIVEKLYERAVEAFVKEGRLDFSYALLLYEFGLFIGVKDHFSNALDALNSFEEKGAFENLLLGKIYLQLAQFEEDEKELIANGVNAFKLALQDDKELHNHSLVIAGQLIDHALLLKSKHKHQELTKSLLQMALDVSSDINGLMQSRLQGCALFHLASIESHIHDADIQHALENAIASSELLKKVVREDDDPTVSDYQILAQSLLLLSSLDDDDESAIVAFDEAAEALRKALELDPKNEGIRGQLVDMQIFNE